MARKSKNSVVGKNRKPFAVAMLVVIAWFIITGVFGPLFGKLTSVQENNNASFLPKGAIGKLGIKGPGMFDAYLSPPLKRSEVLVNGYFITADFAMVLDDGSVKIHGREKSMINVSGNKVFPEEVEGVLETYPGIKLAKVSAIPHRLMGQIIKADIVLSNSVKEIDQEEVLTYCRKRLSTYKIPQKIDIVSAVEMTATGKIQR